MSTHTGSDGSEPADRAEAAGYRWKTISENVAAGQPDAAGAVAAWMASPGHRANILDPDVRHLGVAWAGRTSGGTRDFWVALFGDVLREE